MNELIKKEKQAIECLKAYEPEDGYYLAYSGGKDSDVILSLARQAGVKYEAVHNLTSVDAPETVRYIKNQADVRIDMYDRSMWQLIADNGIPPTRLMRYCCAELKERGGQGRLTVTGVRKAESNSRQENGGLIKIIGKPVNTLKLAEKLGIEVTISKKGGIIMNDDNDENRRMVEQCYRTRKTMVNPIVEWTDNNVWDYLHYYGIKANPLYQCGFRRIGCIGCPMAGKKEREREFSLYPKYKENYIKAFRRMLITLKNKTGEKEITWKSGEDVFNWWTENYIDVNQLSFFEED